MVQHWRIQEFEGGVIEYLVYTDDEVGADDDDDTEVIRSGGDGSDDELGAGERDAV
ncbi:hypothetical protein ACFYO1_42330 [Nocardia sp. NPDC006044]|uniref:hypothetical protein n=1 Tax=Nocardia sp. NPDC006044 TaxID=3364306 RepID=UPI00369D0DEF